MGASSPTRSQETCRSAPGRELFDPIAKTQELAPMGRSYG